MKGRIRGTFWPAAWLAAGLATATFAQATVELKVRSREVFVGEACELIVQVADFQSCEKPEIPPIPNAIIREAGGPSDSQFTSIINGRVTQSRTRSYQYELTPQTVGELVIPPVSVKVDGRVLKTPELKLNVRPSDADQLFAIEISAGRNRVYVGQRVPLTMTVWVKPARYGGVLLDATTMLQQMRPIELGPFPRQVRNDYRRPRPRPGAEPDDLYYCYQFATNVVPERPGPLTFDNIELGLDYPTRTGSRSLRARPVADPIEVLPVPMEGRPAEYAGAVGLFDIAVDAQPTEVRVGDPIELTIDIFGDGPVETLPPPLLGSNPALTENFRLPTEQLTGQMEQGRRRFRVTIRAKREDVNEIPSIEYPYFDPDAERFVIARSKPIPLTVRPAAEASPQEVGRARVSGPAIDPAALQALDGLHDIETSEAALLANRDSVSQWAVTALMVVPPAVFGLSWAGIAYVRRRTADPARQRRQAALPAARRRITRARSLAPRDQAREVAAALVGYLADRLNEPPGRFTATESAIFLRQRSLPPRIVEQWAAVVDRCEQAAFAGSSLPDGDSLCSQALACLRALERHKL